jgi:hypothetical protein
MSDKPKLVVDNKLLDEDEDFETIAEQILEITTTWRCSWRLPR